MSILAWTPELACGIHEIDSQHKRIVAYINQLYELRTTQDRARLADVIGEMVDYTMSHFAFEEELMENAGYSFSGPHRKVHQLFTRRVAEMQARFEAGEDVAAELHGMLSRWLFNHILHEDRAYVDAVKVYLRTVSKPAQKEREQITAEVVAQMQKQQKKGWFARLFGG